MCYDFCVPMNILKIVKHLKFQHSWVLQNHNKNVSIIRLRTSFSS